MITHPDPRAVGPGLTHAPRLPISPAIMGLILLATVGVAYAPVLSAGFIWDDDGHLTRTDLRSLAGLGRIWFEIGATQQYYPLLHTVFWLEHRLWDDWALGYHAVNLVWHSLAAWLFGLTLRRLAVPGAWLGAFLFALHPVCVESVAWISEQKNTLSLVLLLAAALAYWRFEDERSARRYLLATGCFLLALMTKSVTATLPAALLVVGWWRRGRIDPRRDLLPLVPWLVLGAAAGLLTAWVEREHIGAEGEAFALGPLERVLLAGRVIWFYLGKLAWPHPLIFVYPRWEIDASSATACLFPAAGLLACVLLVVLARRGRRAPLTVGLLFVGTLFPVLGFVNVYPFIYAYVADHFQYHASLAWFAGVAALLVRLTRRLPRIALLIGAAGLVVLLGTASWRQSRMYRSEISLYETTIARNPQAWLAHNNLGIALERIGQPAEALWHYREAARLRPDNPKVLNNLGRALGARGQPTEAIAHLRRAVELRPGFLPARNNLAIALEQAGRAGESIALFRETLALYPQDGDAHFNLGLALARAGHSVDALACFEQAAAIRPDDAKFVLHVALALVVQRRFDEAMRQFQRAASLEPGSVLAHYAFGRALAEQGRPEEGIPFLDTAVRLDPEFEPARRELERALARVGRNSDPEHHRAPAPPRGR